MALDTRENRERQDEISEAEILQDEDKRAQSFKGEVNVGKRELVKTRFNFHGMRTELEIRTNKGEGAEEREISFEKHQNVFEHSTSPSQVHKRTRKAGYGAGWG